MVRPASSDRRARSAEQGSPTSRCAGDPCAVDDVKRPVFLAAPRRRAPPSLAATMSSSAGMVDMPPKECEKLLQAVHALP